MVSTGNYVDNINLIVENKRLELNNNLKRNIIVITIFLVVSLIVIGIVSLILSKKISDPIIKLVKAFEKDDNGQISIKKIKLNSKDEIGLLANTLNKMVLQINGFINGVIKEANNVADSANTVELNMSLLNEQVDKVSLTTQEVSTDMEETAASTEEMDASVTDIMMAVESISTKAQEGVMYVKEIGDRARNIKYNLNSTLESGTLILNETKEKLNYALEESKSVIQINELADSILQITKQTNLLALNAASSTNIAQRVMSITEKLQELLAQATKSKECSQNLKSLVLKFKV